MAPCCLEVPFVTHCCIGPRSGMSKPFPRRRRLDELATVSMTNATTPKLTNR